MAAAEFDPLSATLPPDPLVGATIDGRYAVERVLGEGGMGLVYRAHHVVLRKPLAIKVLRAELSENEQVIARFVQEAQSATAIGNQHIIDVLDFGRLPDGATYFVMEYLDGQPLSAVLGAGPMAPARFVHVLRQLCVALGAAHGAGIVHRDLKPDNIFLVRRGAEADFVKVLDFGIAKVGGTSSKLTQAGQVFGTPHYMAPEQCQGHAVDLRADVYALGVLAFEMLTGSLPFESETMVGLLTAHLTEVPPLPSSRRPEVARFDALVSRCMAKDREHRPATCEVLLAELEAAAAGLPTEPRVSGIVEATGRRTVSTPPPPKQRALLFAGVGLAAVGGLAMLGVAALLLRPPAPADASSARLPGAPVVSSAAGTPPAPAPSPRAVPTSAQVADSIALDSTPPGAEVWSGADLVGTTPLAIPRPGAGARVEYVLKATGHDDHPLVVSDRTLAEHLMITLTVSHAAGRAGGGRGGGHESTSAPAGPEEPPRRRSNSEIFNPWGN